VYEGISGVLFSRGVEDSNLHVSLDVLRNANEAAYDLLPRGGRVVAVVVLSRDEER
jgi:hypothetical protein